jgi:hypothetical protein
MERKTNFFFFFKSSDFQTKKIFLFVVMNQTDTTSSSSPDRRHQVMGARTRKAGYCGHVPLCNTFGVDDPFTKIQEAIKSNNNNGGSTRTMTQDNTSLRKGMSSHTSYREIMNKVEANARKEKEEAALLDSPRAPKLDQEIFGNAPPQPKLISGFSGHRPHHAFVVGESVNAADKEVWREHVFEQELAAHHDSHPRKRPIAEVIAERREREKAELEEIKRTKKGPLGEPLTDEEAQRLFAKKKIPLC